MVTISVRDGLTLVDRAAKNVDWSAVERQKRAEAARAREARIVELRHNIFCDAARGNRDINALTDQPAAARLLIAAGNNADSFQVLAIVRVAIDNQWPSVVQAGVCYFGDHPVADRIQELWRLTHSTGRSLV